jgi:type IX secretion system PorP/SprF family membrane protein
MLKRLFICVCFIPCIATAQHPYYGALDQQLLSTNPAFAGSNKQLRVQAIGGTLDFPKYGYYKDGYYFGVDGLAGKHSGLGLSAHREQNGPAFSNTQIDLNYAYHINIGEKTKLVPAIQASVFQERVNRNYVSYDDLYGGRIPEWNYDGPSISTKANLDLSAGLMFYRERFFAGASALSFTQPDEGVLGVSKRPLTQVYQMGYRYPVTPQSSLDGYAFFKTQKTRETFLQYGLYYNIKYISLHLANRINDISNTNVVVIGANFNVSGFKIGYNCNWNYSKHTSNYFFNEVYLSINFGAKKTDERGVKLFY